MTDYDPEVLERLAERLYMRAAMTEILYPLASVIVGAAMGYGAGRAVDATAATSITLTMTLVFGLALLIVGLLRGSSAAFELRVKAQQSLWMVKIEKRLHDTSGLTTGRKKI
jgi:hypothetical protein